jgi:hypothetical protein
VQQYLCCGGTPSCCASPAPPLTELLKKMCTEGYSGVLEKSCSILLTDSGEGWMKYTAGNGRGSRFLCRSSTTDTPAEGGGGGRGDMSVGWGGVGMLVLVLVLVLVLEMVLEMARVRDMGGHAKVVGPNTRQVGLASC